MSPDLATLSISRIIIHDVPYHKKAGGGGGPTLSQIESPTNAELILFISEHIKKTIKPPNGFQVVRDPQSQSPMPQLILDILNGGPNFVRDSQTAAMHLYAVQTGVNPGGLLAICDCQFGDGTGGLAILKLEREEGVRLQQDQVRGRNTFQLSLLHELILTQKTKLYKIGLFTEDDGEPVGTVCDQQRGYTPRSEIASFFLSTFLGFRLKEEPTVSTKRFFESAEEFINENVDNPVDQAEYHGHLVSELLSNRQIVNPNRFANDYLKTRDRQRFISHLREQGAPTVQFPKDNELIDPRLKKTVIEFESGIQVRGKQEALDEKMTLRRQQGREVEATIKDRLKDIR